MTQLPPEWLRWVDENIARGVLQQTLIDTLVQHHFAPALAEDVVRKRIIGFHVDAPGAPTVRFDSAEYSYDNYQHDGMGLEMGNSVLIDGHKVTVGMRMEKPHLMVFNNVLSRAECEQLITISKSRLEGSTTVDDLTGNAEPHPNRTSRGASFNLNENAFIAKLDKRISKLMQLPVVNGEGLQILNYQVGGEYKPHYDYFPPELPGSIHHIAHGGQRCATLVIYLNNVPEGGETIFPHINLNVVPVQGSAVYFSYVNAQNQIDSLTYHGGNPVLKGEKWIATKWMRQREYK